MLAYYDAYLSKHCTSEREARAYADVDLLGTFTEAWRDKLTVVKCYILACLENQAQADDLFAEKLKAYNTEFRGLLAQARSVTEDSEGNILSVFSIPLERA